MRSSFFSPFFQWMGVSTMIFSFPFFFSEDCFPVADAFPSFSDNYDWSSLYPSFSLLSALSPYPAFRGLEVAKPCLLAFSFFTKENLHRLFFLFPSSFLRTPPISEKCLGNTWFLPSHACGPSSIFFHPRSSFGRT